MLNSGTNNIDAILTEDGSYTLFNNKIGEHYHSIHGAIQESQHVFIKSGLAHCKEKEIHIFEIGFGTGLNAFLAYKYGKENNIRIHYTTIEAFPIDIQTAEKINYGLTEKEKKVFMSLHKDNWGRSLDIDENFSIEKINEDLSKFILRKTFQKKLINVIFFDAFSPEVQSDLWEKQVFEYLYNSLSLGGILTTYCAKGYVRRNLKEVGFEVERLAGPPGKREILRAQKLN